LPKHWFILPTKMPGRAKRTGFCAFSGLPISVGDVVTEVGSFQNTRSDIQDAKNKRIILTRFEAFACTQIENQWNPCNAKGYLSTAIHHRIEHGTTYVEFLNTRAKVLTVKSWSIDYCALDSETLEVLTPADYRKAFEKNTHFRMLDEKRLPIYAARWTAPPGEESQGY